MKRYRDVKLNTDYRLAEKFAAAKEAAEADVEEEVIDETEE